jgi:VanZ family protein
MITSSAIDAPSAMSSAADARPDFIARLGLLLPCSVDDVEAAYRARAKHAHPDVGGSVEEFRQLQADYEAAREYARFQASRRGWLGATVERYAAQQAVIAEIERRGGSVTTKGNDWIAREIGDDFAQVLETVVGIRLSGPTVRLWDVQHLANQHSALGALRRLDLSNGRIGNAAVELLDVFPTLHELDLSGTCVDDRSVAAIGGLRNLQRINLSGTFVSWCGRYRLRRRRPELEIITREADAQCTAGKRGYRWVFRLLVLYMVAMFIATHIPDVGTRLPRLRTWIEADKLAHFGMYFGFTTLLACVVALRRSDRALRTGLSVRGYLAIAAFVALFAAADEMTQPLTGRQLDIRDWLADMAGMAAALLVFSLVQLYRHARQGSAAPSPAVAAMALAPGASTSTDA